MQTNQNLAAQAMPDWPAIAAVVLGVTAFSVAQGVTYPLISLVLESRGVSSTLIGINAFGFALGLAAATLMIGRLTQRFRAQHLIVAGLIGCSLCLATFASFSSMSVWFVARFVLGFCASVIFMLSEAWLNVACPDRLRGRVSGIYGAAVCAGFAVGPLAIPLFGTAGGFGFALTAVYLALVAFATGLLLVSTRTVPEPSSTTAVFSFFRHAPMLVAMVFAFGFADIAAISAMPVYFVKNGHSEAFAALSVTVLALPTALAQPFIGYALDRLPKHRVAVVTAAAAAGGFIALPFLDAPAPILVAFGLIGAASFSLYTCALAMLGENYRGSMLVAGSAAYGLTYAVGSGAGSSLTGLVMEVAGLEAGPLMVGAALAVFTAMFAMGGRKP